LTLDLDTITAISRAIAADNDPRLEVIGVASSDGGSDRVELLVTLRGCHQEPCILMLNLTRTEPSQFERELRLKLREKLADHRRHN
jgi:hypothetical protein